jgi:hypothetical protein
MGFIRRPINDDNNLHCNVCCCHHLSLLTSQASRLDNGRRRREVCDSISLSHNPDPLNDRSRNLKNGTTSWSRDGDGTKVFWVIDLIPPPWLPLLDAASGLQVAPYRAHHDNKNRSPIVIRVVAHKCQACSCMEKRALRIRTAAFMLTNHVRPYFAERKCQ